MRGCSRKRVALFLGLGIVLSFPLYALFAGWMVKREDARVSRNPVSGIQRGAEAFVIGPEDSSGAVLFVHGFVGGSSNFADVPERLAAQGWRVEAVRLPGHGTSPRELAGVSADELVHAVEDKAKELHQHFNEVVLVGHSMGGAIVTLLAAEGLADKLVLAAPYFGVTHRWYYLLTPETWAQLATPIVPWLYKGHLFLQVNRVEAKNEIFSYTWVPGKAIRTLMELGRRARRPALLGAIHCPTVILHGEGDVAASFEAAQQAWAALGTLDKEFVRLPNSNHHIFYDYDREQVSDAVAAFVGRPGHDS